MRWSSDAHCSSIRLGASLSSFWDPEGTALGHLAFVAFWHWAKTRSKFLLSLSFQWAAHLAVDVIGCSCVDVSAVVVDQSLADPREREYSLVGPVEAAHVVQLLLTVYVLPVDRLAVVGVVSVVEAVVPVAVRAR